MDSFIVPIIKTRQFLLTLVNDLSVDALNKIPDGFNNNIVWNLGHLIAAQQGICYVRSGLATAADEKYFRLYKPGTKPEAFVETEEIELMKEVFLSSLKQLDVDYERGLFKNYPAWTTRYGVDITSIDDAIHFLMYHEGLHTGTIMAFKKLIVA